MYTYPGEKLMGGIMKRDETSIKKTKAGVVVYLYAESIDQQIEVWLFSASTRLTLAKMSLICRKSRKRTGRWLERCTRRATMA